jgi:hypothetical protein
MFQYEQKLGPWQEKAKANAVACGRPLLIVH